jgi:antitoxin PrlF
MSTATLTSKGQITIPAVVRASLGVSTGGRVEFVQIEAGRFEIMAATLSVSALKGMVQAPKATVTIAQMNAVIEARGATAK